MHKDIDITVQSYLKSLTLLCVEDNKTTQLIYKSILNELFKEIIFANNGNEGYEKFNSLHVDIIISDYDMPIADGINMIENIRQKDKDIPILLVSAITDIDVIVKALQLHVNNFIKKPIDSVEVIQSITNVTKLLIANKYLKEQEQSRLKELEDKNEYSSYQEDLAFSKELNILRNDFYYQMIDNEGCVALIDFFYKPLDILSGDAYSVRKIDANIAFYFIVDGMGKGLSASLSSMLMTSYINHLVDKMKSEFDLAELIESALDYIKPILLDEEAISIDFICINCKNKTIDYAKFAMPSILMQTKKMDIIKLKSNNGPVSKYIQDFSISSHSTENISKFLIYSDGVTENSTKIENKIYQDFIEEDFINSYTKEDMATNILSKMKTQEDDITFIFINNPDFSQSKKIIKNFKTNLDEVSLASDWYAQIWSDYTNDELLINNTNVVFTELFMNAYEHGNLSLDSNQKQKLLADDTYFTVLEQLQEGCTKEISVQISTIKYASSLYIFTQITDEGDGFDTQILSYIFKKAHSFNGRGVFISKKLSMGIYYNSRGNSVMFLFKV